MNRFTSLIIFALAMLSACAPKQPSNVLSPSRMEDVLVDYHLAQGLYDVEGGGEHNRYNVLQSVFRKHRITEAQFDTSMVWYSTNSEKLLEIYVKVEKRVQARVAMFSNLNNSQTSKYQDLTAEGDTCNVWALAKFVALQPTPLQNIYYFSQPVDSTYEPGDQFIWHFKTDFLAESGHTTEAYALLNLSFEGDTAVSVVRNLYSNEEAELTFTPTTGIDSLQLTGLEGFIYISLPKDPSEKVFRLLNISDLALIRMHKVDTGNEEVEETEVADEDSTNNDLLELNDAALDVRLSPTQRRDAKPHRSLQNIQKVRPVYNRSNNSRQTRRRTR